MENVFFKQSFRGFDRQEVLAYIDDLTGQMNARAASFAKTQQDLESQIDELSNSLDKSEKCLNLCNEHSRKLAREVDSLKKDNEELKTKVSEYKNTVFEKGKEFAILKSEFEKISRDNEALSKDNLHWKSRQDDIAAVMVEAQNQARQIVEQANIQARETKAQLNENAALLQGRVSDVKGEISRIESQLEASFTSLSSAMQKMEEAGNAIETQVKKYREDISYVDGFIDKKSEATPKSGTKEPEKTLTDNVLDTITRLLEK
jgi:cell division septum initiation protein DivIVA